MKKLLAALVVLSALQSPVQAQSMMDLAYVNTVMDDSSPSKTKTENSKTVEDTEIFAPVPKNMTTFDKVATTVVGIMSLGVFAVAFLLIIDPILPDRK